MQINFYPKCPKEGHLIIWRAILCMNISDDVNRFLLSQQIIVNPKMKCTSGNGAEFLCINQQCQTKNVFMCSDPHDQCKGDHERCSLINLPFLLKKSHFQKPSKNNPSKYEKLKPIQEKAKIISSTVSSALASANINKQINSMLEGGKLLTRQDKEKISRFMNDRKLDEAQQNIFFNLEKDLQEFLRLIIQFQMEMKETREREIKQLKKKLRNQKQERIRPSKFNIEKNVSQIKQERLKPQKQKRPSQIAIDVGKDNLINEIEESPKKFRRLNSKYESPMTTEKKKKSKNSKSKHSSPQKTSKIIQKNLHVPKGPLFSKITNDVAAIYSFFQDGFKTVNLLYRASQNDFQVSLFHQKCLQARNTITLIETESDKIIGGFTPLPWKSGGGEWYEDPHKQTFIFSLTTGERYPLHQRDRAIWCSKNYGPSFGFPDLEIADKANSNSNSCANFPNCFNNGNYKKTPESLQILCGSKSGHFKIKEWEVYELTF